MNYNLSNSNKNDSAKYNNYYWNNDILSKTKTIRFHVDLKPEHQDRMTRNQNTRYSHRFRTKSNKLCHLRGLGCRRFCNIFASLATILKLESLST